MYVIHERGLWIDIRPEEFAGEIAQEELMCCVNSDRGRQPPVNWDSDDITKLKDWVERQSLNIKSDWRRTTIWKCIPSDNSLKLHVQAKSDIFGLHYIMEMYLVACRSLKNTILSV